jgi:hypothetical protein
MVINLVIILAVEEWLVVFGNVEHLMHKVKGHYSICQIPSPQGASKTSTLPLAIFITSYRSTL